jgi:hypothetical protein
MNKFAVIFARCPFPKLCLGEMSDDFFNAFTHFDIDTRHPIGFETKHWSFFVLRMG